MFGVRKPEFLVNSTPRPKLPELISTPLETKPMANKVEEQSFYKEKANLAARRPSAGKNSY